MVPFLLQARWHIDSTYPIPIATSQYPTSITTPYILPQHFCWVVWPRWPPEAPPPGQLCWLGAIIHGEGQMPHLIPATHCITADSTRLHAGVWKNKQKKNKKNKNKKKQVPDRALLSHSPILSKVWVGGHFAVRIFATPFTFSLRVDWPHQASQPAFLPLDLTWSHAPCTYTDPHKWPPTQIVGVLA